MGDYMREIQEFKSGYFAPTRKPNGVDLIAQERQRQIEKEGWTAEHDKQHTADALAWAAISYSLPPYCRGDIPEVWPWDKQWWKPTPNDRIRELVKGGALIAAEIDRLQALKVLEEDGNG